MSEIELGEIQVAEAPSESENSVDVVVLPPEKPEKPPEAEKPEPSSQPPQNGLITIGHIGAMRMPAPEAISVVGGRARLNSIREIRESYDSFSKECRLKGPWYLINRASSRWAPLTLVVFAAFSLIVASVGTVLYNLTLVHSRSWNVASVVTISIFEYCGWAGIYFFFLFFLYPNVTRSRKLLVLFCFLALLKIASSAVVSALCPTAEVYWTWTGLPTSVLIATRFEAVTTVLLWVLPFEVARHRSATAQKRAGTFVKRTWKQRIMDPSNISLFTSYLFIIANWGPVLVIGGESSFILTVVSWVSVAVMLILQVVILAIPGLTVTWSLSHLIIFGVSLNSGAVAANLLLMIMAPSFLGNTVILSLVKVGGFLMFYGVTFSVIQLSVSFMTESFHTPQAMFFLQLFLEVYLSLAFAEVQGEAQFWALLVAQSAWGLFRSTGGFSEVYLRTRDKLREVFTRKKVIHSKEWLMHRDQFIFILNAQSVFGDALSSLIIPALVSIDTAVRGKTGVCGISCSVKEGQLAKFIERYGIIFAFRVATLCVVVLSYGTRYAKASLPDGQKLTASRILQTCRALTFAFHLHILRNIFLFLCILLYGYINFLYSVIEFHYIPAGGPSSSVSLSS